ncbi:unnamed protein product [Larinioides sclopetarius]|uniref:Uncharacterized protein n=1 Tax=Larinioides sclopetarius TaxID=280406 RepID=A0AAV1ZT64_9ARAC
MSGDVKAGLLDSKISVSVADSPNSNLDFRLTKTWISRLWMNLRGPPVNRLCRKFRQSK